MPRYEVRQDDYVIISMVAASTDEVPSSVTGDPFGGPLDYAKEMANMGCSVAQIASRMGSYSGLYEVGDEPLAQVPGTQTDEQAASLD